MEEKKAFYYLGGNMRHFVNYLQQELNQVRFPTHPPTHPPTYLPTPSLLYTSKFLSTHPPTHLQAEAKDTGVQSRQVLDLAQEKTAFASLWREGRLLVEDPNTLDLINNKTSFGELLMTYTHRMKVRDSCKE